LFDWLVVIS